MTGDLVKWLRELGEHPCRSELPMGVGLRQAAIVLEALEAENKRLRYHLEGTLDTLQDAEICFADCVPCAEARAALGEKQ